MRLGLLLVSALAAACTPAISPCVSGTVFASVTLEGAAEDATQLLIDVSVGSGAPLRTTLTHEPGATFGGVQIEFPKGYPKGEKITVTITATTGNSTIAAITKTITLSGGCVATSFVLDGSASDAGSDGAGGDDLPTTPPSDLRPPPTDFTGVTLDLICSPTTEDCFNGLDDDCDGAIDCADTDCDAGAICVPDPGTFTPGTLASTTCSADWPTTTTVMQNLTYSCSTNGCTGCSYIDTECRTKITVYDSDSTCTTGPMGGYNFASSCLTGFIPDDGYYTVGAPFFEQTICGAASGTGTKVPASATTSKFCSRATVGGGCSGGAICVPRAAQQCVMKEGDSLTCPTGYTATTTPYFLGIDDSARSCQCSCISTNGSCAGSTTVQLWTNSTCTGEKLTMAPGCAFQPFVGINSISTTAATIATAGTCGTTTFSNQPPARVGEQTICCTP